jgi:hypothetical protein
MLHRQKVRNMAPQISNAIEIIMKGNQEARGEFQKLLMEDT